MFLALKKVNYTFPFLSCSPVTHTELSVPVVLFQQGAVLRAPREIQAVFKSLSVLPSTSWGQDFNSQPPNQICKVGIHYMLPWELSPCLQAEEEGAAGSDLLRAFPTQVPHHHHAVEKSPFWQRRGLCPCLVSQWCVRDLHQGWESHRCFVQIRALPKPVGAGRTPRQRPPGGKCVVETSSSLGRG